MVNKIRINSILICFIVFLSFGCFMSKTLAVNRYCGIKLTEIMRAVCINGFNGKPVKRKGNDFDNDAVANDIFAMNMSKSLNSLIYPVTNYSSVSTSPFWLKLYMLTQTRHRRSSGGIYYDCCLRGCTNNEMRQYCL